MRHVGPLLFCLQNTPIESVMQFPHPICRVSHPDEHRWRSGDERFNVFHRDFERAGLATHVFHHLQRLCFAAVETPWWEDSEMSREEGHTAKELQAQIFDELSHRVANVGN